MTATTMESLTDAFDAAALIVVGGLTAAAIIKTGPRMARWGYNQILSFFR